MVGTIYNPDQEYFYDNIWADLVLNSGEPEDGSLYAYVDLFTWRGWFETVATIAVLNLIKDIAFSFILIVGYVVFYAMAQPGQYKFCEGEEIAWGIKGVYEYFPCKNLDFL